MDGLVKELLRLESAKHQALVEIDEAAYDQNVRKQQSLISSLNGAPVTAASDVGPLLALSQLITLNTRLLQDLTSTASPTTPMRLF